VRVRGVLGDAGLAGLLVAASLLLGANTFLHSPYQEKMVNTLGGESAWARHLTWWWLAAVPAVAGLMVRRRWPLPAFLLAAASAAVHQIDAQMPRFPMDLAVLVTLYSVASLSRSRRASVTMLAVAVFGLYALNVVITIGIGQPSGPTGKIAGAVHPPLPQLWQYTTAGRAASDSIVTWLLLGVAWAVGDGSRTRRAHLATMEQRAADLERERDQRAALAAVAERARITRELHDVVAHGLSVMVVQAQGAAAALRRHPDRTATALENVIEIGRTSLAEMRRLLGMARAEAAPQLAPQPGIGALPALVDQVRAAGTPVELHIDGEPVALPAGVDLSAYRIVQEALTNTLKHAGAGARASVRLDFRPGELEIEVTDDGRVASTMDGNGNGLRGISERVGMLGGSVTAGPGDGDGFRVRARLPVTAS
jgi:signal transduction histidine kinase